MTGIGTIRQVRKGLDKPGKRGAVFTPSRFQYSCRYKPKNEQTDDR
jgi:hypothetical protein